MEKLFCISLTCVPFFRHCNAFFGRNIPLRGNSTRFGWNNTESWSSISPIFETATKCSRSVKIFYSCSSFLEEERNIVPCDRLPVPLGFISRTPPLRSTNIYIKIFIVCLCESCAQKTSRVSDQQISYFLL